MADQRRNAVVDVCEQFREVVVDAGAQHLHTKVGEFTLEIGRVRQIRLGHAHHRGHAADKGGNEGTLHKTGARWGIGGGHHDEQQLRIGDDDALVRVRIVSRAAQDRGTLLALHNARQRVLRTGGVTDDADTVADLDRGALQVPGAGALQARGVVVKHDAPTPTILRHDQTELGIIVRRAVLRAWP